MADGLFGGAAFGVYPQMQPRRRLQDVQGSANLPIDVLRGRIAGLFGLVPDVLNFMGRSPMPTETFGETQYDPRPQLPYDTDYYLKNLPMAPTSRVGQVAGQAASFVPLNPMPAVRGVQRVGQMVGEELGATMMGQRPGSMMSKVVPQPLFAVAPEQGLFQTKPQAPVSDIGFYSAAEQAALNLGRNKGTGQSFINDLMKAPDVKKEELQFTGLDEFLRDKPNVTKQEVQDFLANNRVDVQETQLGGSLSPEMQATRDALNNKYKVLIDDIADAKSQFEEGKITYAQVRNIVSNNQIQIEALNSQIKEINNTIPPTKFGQYTLAGGENYREILLTLPNKPMEAGMAGENWYTQFIKRGGEPEWSQLTPVRQQEIINSMPAEARNYSTSPEYRSSHFNEPNILAHMRVNDRVDADGKKMLLVEEIQSDWHQAGREKGYASKETKRIKGTVEEQPSDYGFQTDYKVVWEDGTFSGGYGTKEIAEEVALKGKSNAKEGVPDAPFKDTWYQLALKRLTKYAADNGYERIGLTTGKQQASRFDLSKQVDEIAVPMVNEDGSRSVRIDPTSGTSIKLMVDDKGIVTGYGAGSTQFSGKKLSEVIGKDIADKVMKADADTKFTGLDLSVGGEGMKKYYDEIYPKFLDKYGKKYGASVGETQIKTGNAYAQTKGIPATETIRYLDVTPKMKEGTSKGQPLFAATPIGALTASEFDFEDPFGNTIADTTR
jgi:hypothetical protein